MSTEKEDLAAEGWRRIADDPPPRNVLCVIFFPLCVCQGISGGNTYHGPITVAYWRDPVWVYADQPTKVRFEPSHWRLL